MIDRYLRPIRRSMALGTILAVSTGMLVIFLVAGVARLGSRLQLGNGPGIDVATAASDRSMLARQLITNRVMVEPFSVCVDAVVTPQALIAKGIEMCLRKNGIHAAMAIEAYFDVEFINALHVAIEALEVLAVRFYFMSRQ